MPGRHAPRYVGGVAATRPFLFLLVSCGGRYTRSCLPLTATAMTRHYQPRSFFRRMPNRLLGQYFHAKNLLSEVDFSRLQETQTEPIYQAWLELSEDARADMEQQFREIDAIACEAGQRAILDEAEFHGEPLAEQFAKMDGFEEVSFWTFLERPKYWPGSVFFHHADRIPNSYWRKRKNLPRVAPAVDDASRHLLEEAVADYFHQHEGRGRHCQVEIYRRKELEYFFVYPEDFARTSIEWHGASLKRRAQRAAFEVIFVYSPREGCLDTYVAGSRTTVPELQAIFSQIILRAPLPPDVRDERVYDLNLLKERQFAFVYGPTSGIKDVAVRKLRFSVFPGQNRRIILDVDPTANRTAIYDLLDEVARSIPLSRTSITQASMKVTFSAMPGDRRARTRTFDVSWPNSCSLGHDGRDAIIRQVLIASGIEPREPATERDD